MKTRTVLLVLILPFILCWTNPNEEWIVNEHKNYKILYTSSDSIEIENYIGLIENGEKSVIDFFNNPFKTDFNVIVHPNRISLDSTWQSDWNAPNFKSQCWMIASGIAEKLDLLSPQLWDSLACEHDYSNPIETQQLFTHELVHVYHGQLNESKDFNNVTGIDWFIEGLATYVSGQCDLERITDVKNAIIENNIPSNLNKFWSGKNRYGLCGTLVMYIDKKYGRTNLFDLLKFNDIQDILRVLDTSETDIINGWKEFLTEL